MLLQGDFSHDITLIFISPYTYTKYDVRDLNHLPVLFPL